jgi:TonB family protein
MQRRIADVLLLVIALAILTGPFYLHAQDQGASGRRVLSRVVPQYPDLARSMRLAGTVKVLVVVAPGGTPISKKVIGGHPLLARAAADAIEKWKWETAPEETKELVEIRFHPD